jgi:trans-aconitate 2-methyltransferase
MGEGYLIAMPWNPDLYHKFQAQRSAPFYDLLALVDIRENLQVIDLGCGTGNLTRELADVLPNSYVTGLDSSPQMLEQAASLTTPSLVFEQGDQSTLTGEWDLIFSNAALHWSENHAELIPHLFDKLKPGGQIAVQIPSNHNHISHHIYRETAEEDMFKFILQGFQRYAPVLPIDDYARILFNCGAEEIHVFEKIYPHVLENADAVVEWISGTALVPYFEQIGEHKKAFVESIREKMRKALPNSPVFYPFRRILFSARKQNHG